MSDICQIDRQAYRSFVVNNLVYCLEETRLIEELAARRAKHFGLELVRAPADE